MELLLEFDQEYYEPDDDRRRRSSFGMSSSREEETIEQLIVEYTQTPSNSALEGLRAIATSGDEDASAVLVIKLLEHMGGEAAIAGAREENEESEEEDKVMDVPSARCDARLVVLGAKILKVMPATKYGPSHRGVLLRGISHVLNSYMGNCQTVWEADGLEALLSVLNRLLKTNKDGKGDGDIKLAAECVRRVAAFATSTLEFTSWLRYAADNEPSAKSFLLDQLNMTLQLRFSRGPSDIFLLDGESSGILGSAQPKWPFSEGLGFVTWVYLESVSASESTTASAASYAAAASASQVVDASPLTAAAVAAAAAGDSEVHMPRLFSFLSAEGQGVECYFHEEFLILETNGLKESRLTIPFSYKFPLKRWFCLGIEHKPATVRTGAAETRLYVNGALVETHNFDLPKISRPLGFCCVGTNPPAAMAGMQRKRRQCALFASLGPVYIFKQALGGNAMKALASRGGSYVPRFPSVDEKNPTNPESLADLDENLVLDRVLASTVLQVLHPRMASKNSVVDISPHGMAVESKAALLGGTSHARRTLLRDSIWAAASGGPAVVLPLACPLVGSKHLQPETSQIYEDFASAGSSIRSVIGILAGACDLHAENVKALAENNVSNLLAHVLPFALDGLRRDLKDFSQSSIGDEEEAIIDALEYLLSVCKQDKQASKQLCSSLILDFMPWTGSGVRMIKRILCICSSMCNTNPDLMQEVSALQILLDNGRRWLSPKSSIMGGILHSNSAKSVMDDSGVLSVTEAESVSLIDELFVSVSLLTNTSGRMSSKVEIIVGFLAECPCPHMLAATVKLVYSIIISPNTERANEFLFAFVDHGGVEVCMGLVRALALRGKFDDELHGVQNLFASCVQLFGYLLETGCVSANKTTEIGGSKKVTKGSIERAVRHAFRKGSSKLITMDVYKQIMHSSLSINLANINMTEPARLISGGMLGSMLWTLSDAGDDVTNEALKDTMLLACAYAENRNMLLSLPEFPEWLIKLLASSQPRNQNVLDAAADLLLIMLQHSMRLPDGWRVLESVLESIALVAKDDFKKTAEAQQAILKGLTGFMINELKGIRISDNDQRKKTRERQGTDAKIAHDNVIALLHMVEAHLRLIASVKIDGSHDLDRVSDALVCYGAHAVESANGWVERSRASEDPNASTMRDEPARPSGSLELLRLTQELIKILVGTDCTAITPSSALLKDDELVHLLLRLTLANFREETLSMDDLEVEQGLPLMPAHIVNTLTSLTSGNSSISDAIAFEAKSLWGTSQMSDSGKRVSVLHNLLVPFLQSASVRKSAQLAPGAIALLFDEIWRYKRSDGRGVVYIKAISAYLIALIARWRDVIFPNETKDIGSKLRALASSTMPTAIGTLCSQEWIQLLMSTTIKETLVCISTSAAISDNRHSVMLARGPGAMDARLSAQQAVQRTRAETFKKFVEVWEGEYVNISMSSKWLAALSKEASRRTLSIAAHGENRNRSEQAWEKYMRDLQAAKCLMVKVKDEGESTRLGINSFESGRRRRYRLSRTATVHKPRLTHMAPVDKNAIEIKLPVREQVDISDDEDDEILLTPQKSVNKEELNEVMAATAALAVAANLGEVKKSNHECAATMVTPLELFAGKFAISDSEMTFTTIDASRAWVWPLETLHQVQSRRYLLRRSALELFMLDRQTYFIDFGSAEQRRQVFRVLIKLRPKNFIPLYLETSKPEALLRKSDITSRWIRREISNFDYLMALNTLAGRSYQDITQYPVFPWVITDYTSETLDLNDPAVYRDLRKPIGALNPTRLERIKERYEFFDDPEIPKFHYGSHYSSSGTVLYYLLRIDPFTTLAYELQGGKFDHADRLFHSVASTWKSCYNDMSDVKELIPEFFYLPEMFKNVNNIDFGVNQKGEKVHDAVLPPWAKSPEDFVEKQREALESEFVSKNLHHWVDLIFGYKQRGKAAESACNVFYYMTYEGAVDVEGIKDPLLLKATQDQIACFGQTPSQLLTVPHPGRQRAADSITGSHWLFDNDNGVSNYALPVPNYGENRASFMNVLPTGQLVVVSPTLEMKIHRFVPNLPGSSGVPFTFDAAKEQSTLGSLMGSIRRKAGFHDVAESIKFAAKLDPKLLSSGMTLPCAAIPNGRFLIVAGHADNSLKVYNNETGAVENAKIGHRAPVVALELSKDGRVLATGSADGTVGIWLVKLPAEKVTIGENVRETIAPIIRINENNIFNDGSTVADVIETAADVATNVFTKATLKGPISLCKGHGEAISSLALNTNLDLLLAVSPFAGASFYSIMKGQLFTKIPSLAGSLCAISDEGFVIIWNERTWTIKVASINGDIITSMSLIEKCPKLTTMTVSSDGYRLAAGTEEVNGQVAVIAFDLPSLNVRQRWDFESQSDITQLVLTADNTNLLAAAYDGSIRLFNDPSISARSFNQMLQAGWTNVV